nr:MAG TPA: hypothetical protein [Bacteriophage sp.]
MRLQNYNKKSDIMSKNADKLVKLSQSVNLCYNLS